MRNRYYKTEDEKVLIYICVDYSKMEFIIITNPKKKYKISTEKGFIAKYSFTSAPYILDLISVSKEVSKTIFKNALENQMFLQQKPLIRN